jgi:hypothetical protein
MQMVPNPPEFDLRRDRDSWLDEIAMALIADHGSRAPAVALIEASDRLEAGDVEGSRLWRSVFHRVDLVLACGQSRPH